MSMLEEKVQNLLGYLGTGEKFMNRISSSISIKTISKWDLVKLKNCVSKGYPHSREKKANRMMKNLCQIYTCQKISI